MSAGTIGFFIGLIVGIGFGMMAMGLMASSSRKSRCEECRTCIHNDEPWDSSDCDGCTRASNHYERKEQKEMTVKELITRLLDEPADAKIMLHIKDEHVDGLGNKCSGYVFDINEVEHWGGKTFLNFVDWRKE